MNENEMNMQNGLNNQPMSPNTGVPPVQPMINNMGTSMGIPNNGGVSQPVNTGVVANSIPKPVNVVPEGTTRNSTVEMPVPNNFMEDFSQAVVPESVIPTSNVSSVQPEMTIATPVVEPTENVSIQNPSPVVEASTPSEVSTSELQQQAISIENASKIQNVEEGKTKKKKGNWAFIIALFAVVGFFVLLLPLLVRIFGY